MFRFFKNKKIDKEFRQYPACDMLNNAIRFLHAGKEEAALSEIIFAIKSAGGYFHKDNVPIVDEIINKWNLKYMD